MHCKFFFRVHVVEGWKNYRPHLHFLICGNASGLMLSPHSNSCALLVAHLGKSSNLCVCVCVWNARPHIIHPPQQTVSHCHLIISSECDCLMWVFIHRNCLIHLCQVQGSGQTWELQDVACGCFGCWFVAMAFI
jgi:hypothetical protein